jgi:uncharacterized protein (TIGR03437 family)
MNPPGNKGGSVSGLLSTRCTAISGLLLFLSLSHASPVRAEDRITGTIDNSQRVTLSGNVSTRIRSAVDQGPVDSSMQLPHVVLALKPSAGQQAALDQLLTQQQDPSSPNYHRWLTPDQYASRFGVSQNDLDKIVVWLGQSGLVVTSVARGHTSISFAGQAGQVGAVFGVTIHHYLIGGETHFANSGDPTIPACLQGLVLAIRGLNDFRPKPMIRRGPQPRVSFQGSNQLGPGDVATIYDINPLYNAGYTGTGQTIAVTGQTDIVLSDIEQYRSYFGLPANDPTSLLVPGSPDPGVQSESGDLNEADLDLELSGGIARNATILFVITSPDYDGAFESLYYAIDEDLAPVISNSYGDCEVDQGAAMAQLFASWGMQANAQGQTIFAPSGDNGAADCVDDDEGNAIDNAESVDLPGSIPEATSVGGTEFNEGSGSYWNSSPGAYQTTARSYIPEIAWNDSAEEGSPAASGGGASMFFSKPSWQTGTGVPADGVRDVPDISIAASPENDGYMVYTQGSFAIWGGTSTGPPQFAAIATLLGQYLVATSFQSTPNLGNVNPTLYALQSVGGVFHDITTGNNVVNPCQGVSDCVSPSFGYYAGVGYDQVTGLGTPDVYNLVTSWRAHTASTQQSVTVSTSASPSDVAFSGSTVLTATVKSANGGTPSGTVTFSTFVDPLVTSSTLGTATLSGSGSSATATLTISGTQLGSGANTITATYNGDSSYFGALATTDVTVSSSSNGTPTIGGISNAASYSQVFAAGGILSVFGTQLAPAVASATTVPLPIMLAGTSALVDGVNVPLYFVSGGQMNIQIPWEAAGNSNYNPATLQIYANGQSATYDFNVDLFAPGIFTMNAQGTGQGAILNSSYQLVDASNPATPGSTYVQLYCTGLGAVNNTPNDGSPSPSNPLAQTTTTPTVTIGGLPATVTFSGLAPGFIGEYQVNVLVPAGVTPGSAVPVVLTIGGVTSNTVTMAVQ